MQSFETILGSANQAQPCGQRSSAERALPIMYRVCTYFEVELRLQLCRWYTEDRLCKYAVHRPTQIQRMCDFLIRVLRDSLPRNKERAYLEAACKIEPAGISPQFIQIESGDESKNLTKLKNIDTDKE